MSGQRGIRTNSPIAMHPNSVCTSIIPVFQSEFHASTALARAGDEWVTIESKGDDGSTILITLLACSAHAYFGKADDFRPFLSPPVSRVHRPAGLVLQSIRVKDRQYSWPATSTVLAVSWLTSPGPSDRAASCLIPSLVRAIRAGKLIPGSV